MLQYVPYNEENTGPTLVAIPALGERKEIFEAMAETLTEFRLVAVDLPGHNGASVKDFSIEKYIADLNKLLKQLSISKAHFIGNSIGAWIIQSFYTKFPETVLSITLLDGGYYFIEDASTVEEEIELPVVEKLEDLQMAIQEQVEPLDIPFLIKERFEAYLLGNFINKDGVYFHHSDADALNALSKAITKTNYCLQEEPQVPLLLLLADQEKVDCEEEKTGNFLLSQKEAIIERIPNSHHLLPITNPTDVCRHFKILVMSLEQ